MAYVLFLTCHCNVSTHRSPEVVGRLDHLVEAVFDRYKDRYYPDESMSRVFTASVSLLSMHSRSVH